MTTTPTRTPTTTPMTTPTRTRDDDSDEAALPDTGAATGLQLIGGSGLVMLLGGFGLLGATRRRPVGPTHRH